MMDAFMRRFSRWFGSSKGVWQTFAFTTAIGIIEQAFPNLDPQHFFYMYFMTYYSTVTQTILAYASNVSSEASTQLQEEIRQIQLDVARTQRNQTDMMRLLLVMAEHMQEGINEIAEDVEDLREEFADDDDLRADNAHRAAVKGVD